MRECVRPNVRVGVSVSLSVSSSVSLRLFLAVRFAALTSLPSALACSACLPSKLLALLGANLVCLSSLSSFSSLSLSWPAAAPPAAAPLHAGAPPCSSTTLPRPKSAILAPPGTTTGTRLGIDGLVGSRAIPGDAAPWANGSATGRLSSTRRAGPRRIPLCTR